MNVSEQRLARPSSGRVCLLVFLTHIRDGAQEVLLLKGPRDKWF